MERMMLKSKIHRATVTGADLDYQGSLTVDETLMEKADILQGEQVHVLNVSSGARFTTYAIKGPAGSGVVVANGAAARLVAEGDKVIILTYCVVGDSEAAEFSPRIVFVDDLNQPRNGEFFGKASSTGMSILDS
jgi:aspartate 1-decarboxylase